MYVCMYVCMYVWTVYLYVCMYVCMYVIKWFCVLTMYTFRFYFICCVLIGTSLSLLNTDDLNNVIKTLKFVYVCMYAWQVHSD